MADVKYDNIPSIIGIYEGTVASFEDIMNGTDTAKKQTFYGRLILITGNQTATDENAADRKQALWTSEDDGTNAHYLNMSDVATLKAQLAHIDGIAFPKSDGTTGYDKYDLTGGKGFIFKGSNGITVKINPSTSTSIDGKPYWTIEVNGQTLKADLIGTVDDTASSKTIFGAKKYADAVGDFVIGDENDLSNANTIYGAKAYAYEKVEDATIQLIGKSSDEEDANTIAGAKKYAAVVAESKATAAKDEAIQASKGYVDPLLAEKADLDGGKIRESQLPDFILGQMIFGGIITAGGANQIVVGVSSAFKEKYDITTDSVTILKTDASDYEGTYFIVSENAGDVLGLGTAVGDWVVSNGGLTWYKIDNTDAVTTVVGQKGEVTAAQIDGAIASIAAASRKLATAVEVNAKYTKPTDGIPSTDMTEAVQKSLAAADSSIQEVTSGSTNYLQVSSKEGDNGLLDSQRKEISLKTVEIGSETDSGDGLATVADIRAYLKARFSVKVVS